MAFHSFNNFEIQIYYHYKPRFNVAYSRNKLPKIKDREYLINHDEYKSIETIE